MYHLKLINALSYTGVVSASKRHPDVYIESQATADEAVATGYFKLVGVTEDVNGTDDGNAEAEQAEESLGYGGKTLEEMNKSELETFATYRDVDIKGAKTKADIIARLRASLDEAELEGEIYYGSPTIQELQKE